MNYVNDSAPMHFASAVNAPVTAVYCSTLPSFGFGPLSDKSLLLKRKSRSTAVPADCTEGRNVPKGILSALMILDCSNC